MQITLGRDSDGGMAEAMPHDFERVACLSADAGASISQPAKCYQRHAAATNELADCAHEVSFA